MRSVVADVVGNSRATGPSRPCLCQLVLHDGELLHDGGVLLLAPGTDDVLIVIAKDGVEHAEAGSCVVTRTNEYARSRQDSGNILHGQTADR